MNLLDLFNLNDQKESTCMRFAPIIMICLLPACLSPYGGGPFADETDTDSSPTTEVLPDSGTETETDTDPTGGTTENTPTSGDSGPMTATEEPATSGPSTSTSDTDGTTGDTSPITTGVSDTDTTTGDPCDPLSCDDLEANNVPDGATYDPVCDPQKGPTRLQYATVVSQGWLPLILTLDDCFNDQGVVAPEGFTAWLLSGHFGGYTLNDWNQPADSCFLGELGSFNPTLPLWALDLNQPLECDVGWNQVKQPTANYCFSGAPTDGDHISLLQIINDTGNGIEFIEGGYLKFAKLFCDPFSQTGFLSQLQIGSGKTLADTDCHTPGGVAGKARIEVDLNGDGGDPNDPNYKFRFVVTGGPNLNVVGPTDQQVCDLI